MVSKDCSPLALSATSKDNTEQHEDPTEQHPDTTEQHEHHFLDPSCCICMGWGRHKSGAGWWAGRTVGFSSNRDLWPGEKVAGWGCLCPRSPQKDPGPNPGSEALGWLQPSCLPLFSSCRCCLQTGSPRVSCQAPSKPPAGWGTVSSREPQAQPLCPLQRCPKLRRSLPRSPRTGGLEARRGSTWHGQWGRPPARAADKAPAFLSICWGKSSLFCESQFPHLCNGTNHPSLVVPPTA